MNAAMLADGKTLCRELGRAVAALPPETAPLPPIETAQLFCEMQHLHALIASAVALRQTPPETYAPLIAHGMQAAAKQLKIDAAEQALDCLFDEAGIRRVVLKGAHTRTFYPPTLARTSADIDWQIDAADAARADTLLRQNGWSCKTADAAERCYEKPPRTRLELHIAPEGFYKSQQQVMQAMLDRAVPENRQRFHLTDSDAYVYALFHVYKHFVTAGAGVRMFLDVFAIETHGTLDTAHIAATLGALGIEGFAARVREINAVLFADADADDATDTLIRYIFAAGAYGDAAAQLALEPLALDATHSSRGAHFLRDYGFSRAAMAKRYPILDRAAILYPFCALHRVCHGLRFRRTVLAKAVDDRRQSRTHRDDMRRILQLASIL